VEQAFASMGSNLLIVLPGVHTAGGAHGGFGSLPTLTWDDLHAIQTEVPTVKYAAPQLRSVTQIVSEDQNWTTTVTGTTPEFFSIRAWRVAQGTLFGPADVEGGTKVAVLGQTVVEKLFGSGANPVGQQIRVKNVPFTVVGVLERKGQSPMGQDYDDAAFIPSTTFRTKIQGGLSNYIAGSIIVGSVSADATARAEAQIRALLRERHRLQPGDDDDFAVRNLAEMASAQQEGASTLTTLLAAIAAVSLLVGGIGIMNIMLVSVTERTREIGIRMAVGAKPSAILAQFLVEALTLSLLGGVIGIVLGIGLGKYLSVRFGWPLLVRPEIVFVSFGFAAAVGVLFGLYPARKASRLDPIEALRYE